MTPSNRAKYLNYVEMIVYRNRNTHDEEKALIRDPVVHYSQEVRDRFLLEPECAFMFLYCLKNDACRAFMRKNASKNRAGETSIQSMFNEAKKLEDFAMASLSTRPDLKDYLLREQ